MRRKRKLSAALFYYTFWLSILLRYNPIKYDCDKLTAAVHFLHNFFVLTVEASVSLSVRYSVFRSLCKYSIEIVYICGFHLKIKSLSSIYTIYVYFVKNLYLFIFYYLYIIINLYLIDVCILWKYWLKSWENLVKIFSGLYIIKICRCLSRKYSKNIQRLVNKGFWSLFDWRFPQFSLIKKKIMKKCFKY